MFSTPTSILPRQRLCRKGEIGKNVMLNLFQHLIKSNGYETLKRVQGDKITIMTQSLKGEDNTWYFSRFEGGGKTDDAT